jgi:hypothetical protein
MSDLYSFFRYTLPGVLFLFETSVAAWILFPQWFTNQISNAGSQQTSTSSAAIGLIIATFAAGAIGYLLTLAYRAPSLFLIDYSVFIDDLIEKKYLDPSTILLTRKATGCIRRRKNSWIIISALWFERSESSAKIKGAVGRTQSLSHLLNSSAAIVTGTGFAILAITASLIWCSALPSWPRIVGAYASLVLALAAQWASCFDAKRTLFEFCKQVLTDTLAEEYKEKQSVLSIKSVGQIFQRALGMKQE